MYDRAIDIIFELIVNLAQGFMFITFCRKFLTPSKSKYTETAAYFAAVFAMFVSITLINLFHVGFAYIEIPAFFAVTIPYCLLFFEENPYIKILLPLSLTVLYSALSFGLNYFFTAIINCDYNYLMVESTAYRYIYVVLSNLIFLIILFLFYKLFKSRLYTVGKKDTALAIAFPLVSIVISALTFAVSSNAALSSPSRVILGLVSIIILSFAFLNFYLLQNISKNYALKNENISVNREKELYRLKIESSQKYINDISSIKHDIKNKLLCIGTLIGKGNYAEARTLCSAAIDNLKAVHFFETGNVYLDSILNVVHNKATEQGVDLIVKCSENLSFLDGDDLLVLIGNLADNAIEALASEDEKILKIYIFRRGDYAIVNIQNRCSTPVLADNPMLKTNKSNTESHGFGLKSVRNVVEKYGGDIDFYEKEDCFFVTVMFDIPITPEK